jgi:hypothetical protein
MNLPKKRSAIEAVGLPIGKDVKYYRNPKEPYRIYYTTKNKGCGCVAIL